MDFFIAHFLKYIFVNKKSTIPPVVDKTDKRWIWLEDFFYLIAINEKNRPEKIRYRWLNASQVFYVPTLSH